MEKSKKPRRGLSLAPLTFEEAVDALLQVKPPQRQDNLSMLDKQAKKMAKLVKRPRSS